MRTKHSGTMQISLLKKKKGRITKKKKSLPFPEEREGTYVPR